MVSIIGPSGSGKSTLLNLIGGLDRPTGGHITLDGQRLAIARALSVFPPILLADEPTGNLDTQTGLDILKLMSELHEQLGSTVLIVTHDMNVAATCQRSITIRDGRIVEDVSASSRT